MLPTRQGESFRTFIFLTAVFKNNYEEHLLFKTQTILQTFLANNLSMPHLWLPVKEMWQGLTIGIHRAHTYNYFCWHTHNFGHGYVDKYTHFFPMIFWSFQIFLVLLILNYLKIYSYIFNSFVLKKPYFLIFHTNHFINASPYLKASTNLKVKKIHKIDKNSSNQRSKNLYLLRD